MSSVVFAATIFFLPFLGGGVQTFFNFHPHLGKIPILTNTFQMG